MAKKRALQIDNVIVWRPGIVDPKTGNVNVPRIKSINRRPNVVTLQPFTTKRVTRCVASNHDVPARTRGSLIKFPDSDHSVFVCEECRNEIKI